MQPKDPPPITPDQLANMLEFGQRAATLYQRHSAGAGGMVRALGEDVVALANAYAAAAAERDFAKRRLDAITRLVAGVGVDDAAG